MSERPDPSTRLPKDVADWIRSMYQALAWGTFSEDLATGSATDDAPIEAEAAEGRRAALQERFAACVAPPDAAVEEKATIDAQRERIGRALTGAKDAGAFATVEAALLELEKVAAAVAAQVESRRARAIDLAKRLQGLSNDATAASGPAAAAVPKEAPRIAGALSPPWSDRGLDAASETIDRLSLDLATAVIGSADKALAKALALRLGTITAGLGVLTEDRASAHAKAHPQLGAWLTEPLDPSELERAGQRIGELEVEIRTAHAALVKTQAELAVGIRALAAPIGAAPAEGTEIEKAKADLLDVLQSDLTPAVQAKVKEDQTGLAARVKTIGEAVIQRKTDAEKARQDAAAVVDPPNANPQEVAELKILREAVAKALTEPYDDEMIKAAQAALTALTKVRDRIDDDAKARETRRKKLAAELGAKKPPADATSRETTKLLKTAADIRRSLDTAADTAALDQVESDLKDLSDELKTLAALAEARKEAAKDVADALSAIKGAASELDAGGFSYLIAAIKALEKKLATASKLADFTQAKTEAGQLVARIGPAKTFSKTFENWLAASELVINLQLAGPDKAAAETARTRIIGEAQKESQKADFAAATGKLAGFNTLSGVTGAQVAHAASYADASVEFESKHRKAFDKIVKFEGKAPLSVMTTKNSYAAALADAQAGNYDQAKIKFDQLAVAVANADRRKFMTEYNKMARMRSDAAVGPALTQAETDYRAGNFTATPFAGVPAAQKQKAVFDALKSKAAGFRGGLRRSAPANQFAVVETIYNDAISDASGATPDYPKATAGLKDFMTEGAALDTFLGVWTPLVERRRALDATDAHGLMTTEETDVAASPPVNPTAIQMGLLKRKLDGFELYQSVKARADMVKAALPPTAPATLTDHVDNEIDTGRDLAETQGEWASGAARLQGLLADDRIALHTAQVNTYLPLLTRATRRVAKVNGMLDNASVRTALAAQMTAATDYVTTSRDYDAGIPAVEAMLKYCDAVQAYAGERRTCRRAIAAIKRAYAGADAPTRTAMDSKMSHADMDTRRDAAEALATKSPPDFEQSRKDYEALRKRLKDLMVQSAQAFEAADGVDSNAGHSIARHGPQISSDLLLRRLQEGIDPDGHPAATATSSQFDDIADWMAARERAIDEAQTDAPTINFSDTSLPCAATTITRKQLIIEHEKPIDKAFCGRNKKPEVGADGSVKPGKTFDAYREMDGLTRSRTLLLFEIDSPDGNATRPKKWKEYQTRYKAANGGATPADMTGRWVVMQHFPEAAGWDPDKGGYE